jgi:muramoyltetrapeptide carboxypeptidase
MGVVSIHGPHPVGDLAPEADAWLRRVLFETGPLGTLPRCGDGPEPRALVPGRAEGPLVGGNLAILASLAGTAHALRAAGAILFLEDVGEPAYRVDRMLLQLERSGALDGVAGLALGRFTECGDEAGTVDEVLAEYAARLGVPTVIGLPFGHVPENLALPVGVRARVDAEDATLTVLESAFAGD